MRSQLPLYFILMTVVLDAMGIGLIMPVMPNLIQEVQAGGLADAAVWGGVMAAVFAVMQFVFSPILGNLSDRFGRRPVLLISMAALAVDYLIMALAGTLWWLLIGRVLGGITSATHSTANAFVADISKPEDRAARFGLISAAFGVGFLLGPMLGGALDMAFGWRSGFVLYAALGLGLLALCWGDWGETNFQRASTFGKQMQSYPELLTSRRFWGYSLCMAFSIGGFYAFITGAPLVAEAWFDLSPAILGLGIGIITGGFMVGNFVTGRLAQRVSLNTLILAGRLSAILGPVAGLALFAAGLGHELVFFGAAICVGFGNGLTVANASAGLMSVRPHLAGSASGLSGALTVAVGAVMTTLTGILVTPEAAPLIVLAIILGASLCAFAAILYVRWLDRVEPLEEPV